MFCYSTFHLIYLFIKTYLNTATYQRNLHTAAFKRKTMLVLKFAFHKAVLVH